MDAIKRQSIGKFQYYILIMAVVLLIVFSYMFTFTSSGEWRPKQSSCPDFWVESGDISGKCFNIHGLGNCQYPDNTGNTSQKGVRFDQLEDPDKYYYFDFNNLDGGNTLCNKQQWANKCNVSWDGINYGFGTKNPCGSD
jgi:hypothetical protein